MGKITNEPKLTGDSHLNDVRAAFEHRATWMYLLMDEARKKGLQWEDFARTAITRCGVFDGQHKFLPVIKDPADLREFEQHFAADVSRDVFEMEILAADADRYYLDFHYCPLVKAWQKQGCSEEEIAQLCDIAMAGDRGIASQFPAYTFTLGQTIAKGDPVCQIRFDKKAK